MKDTILAKELLNAVYEEDSNRVKNAIIHGASPSWIFNGYPILVHAVNLENKEISMMLIQYGATQLSEALGFALEQGIGRMVWPLAYMGIVPKPLLVKDSFGVIPARFIPTSFAYQH